MVGSTFVTDAEIQEYVEGSFGDLFDLIIESNGTRHWIATTSTQSTIAGVAAYTDLTVLPSQPAPIYKVIGVDIQWDGVWRTLRPVQAHDWNVDEDGPGGWHDWREVGYFFYQAATLTDVTEVTGLQQVIRFTPTPQGVHSFRVRFVPYPNDWSAAPTTFLQGYSGWDEYIVADAAAKCLEKEESWKAAEAQIMRRERAADRIRWHASTMDEEGQGRVRDVYEEARRGFPPRAFS